MHLGIPSILAGTWGPLGGGEGNSRRKLTSPDPDKKTSSLGTLSFFLLANSVLGRKSVWKMECLQEWCKRTVTAAERC